MATPASHLLQDQNQNILNHGITPGATAKVDKKVGGGGLGGRKALKDISNARKPSVRHSVRKDTSIDVLSTDRDAFDVKQPTKAPEKVRVGGRKALGDLTNSFNPTAEQVARNIPSWVLDEGLHDHQKCIAAKKKAEDLNMEYIFLKYHQGFSSVQLSPPRLFPSSPKKFEFMEMEISPKRYTSSPAWSPSPSPPSSPGFDMSFEEDDIVDFKLMDSPKLT